MVRTRNYTAWIALGLAAALVGCQDQAAIDAYKRAIATAESERAAAAAKAERLETERKALAKQHDGQLDELQQQLDRAADRSQADRALCLIGATDEQLAALINARPDLETLSLAGSPEVSDAGLKAIGRLQRLRQVDLSGTRIGDGTLRRLRTLPALEQLDVSGCVAVTGSGLAGYGKHKALRSLDLSDTAVSIEGLQELAGCKTLRRLALRQCRNLSPAALEAVARLTNLTALDLANNPLSVDDAGLEHVVALARLRWLDLRDTNVSSAGLGKLTKLADLRHLRLARNLSGVTDEVAAKLAAKLSDLTSLDLSGSGIGDKGLEALQGMKSLRVLRLDDTENLTGEAVDAFSEARPRVDLHRAMAEE